jgi:uncharacterized protein (DUF2345 family)
MAGGSQIIISKEGIKIITPAKFEAKAGQHLFENGQKVSAQLPSLPVPDQPYVLQYLVKDKKNIPLANKPYFIIDEDGNLQKGTTNNQGFMSLKTTAESKNIVSRVMANEIEEAQDANENVEE